MRGHYRLSLPIMHHILHPTLLVLQEGERQPLQFAEGPTGPAAEGTATVAQEGAASGAGAGATDTGSDSTLSFWLMIGLLFLFMWFFVIRPENKRQKERKNFQSALAKNDKVVTMGGLHGTVVAMDDATITLKVADGLRLTFDRVAVARHTSAPKDKDKKEEKAKA